MKNLKRLFVLGSLGFLLASCATTGAKVDPYQDMDLAVSQDDFEGGVELIRTAQRAQRPMYAESNAISLRLDKGLLEHYAGNYDESAEDLMEAERLMEEAYTKSVSEAVASYIANDNTKEYPGEDYEDIYISVFNALNFYHLGSVEDALVEIRKLTHSNGKMDMLSQKYEGARQSAGAWLLQQLSNLGFQMNDALPQGEAVNFSDSALARYLSVLFYLAERNADSARIEHELLQEAFANNPEIYYHAPPSFIPDMRDVPEGKARLHIIGFAGLSPIKEEGRFEQYFPFFKYAALQRPSFKLPTLVPRASATSHNILVSSDGGGESVNLELIEDMGAVMTETFGARFGNIFFKTYIRTMLKYAAADIGASAAEQRTKSALAAQAIALAAQKALDATEKADIRMGRFFPDKAYVGYIDLEPGVHTITVNFDGGVIKEFTDVNVREGSLNLIQAVNLGSSQGGIRTMTASGGGGRGTRPAGVPEAPVPAAAPVAAPEAVPVPVAAAVEKPKLAILHFTGGQGDDGETIAALFSLQNELRSGFDIVPRTSEVNEIVSGRDFQASSFINTDAVAALGRRLNTDYVLAGYIRPVEDRSLLVAYIVHTGSAALVGGSYRLYDSIEEIPDILPYMDASLAAAAKQNSSALPGLAAASETEAADPMTQLLLVDLANTGSYVVYSTPASAAELLSIEAMSLRGINVMVAELLDAESGGHLGEGSLNYGAFEDGMEQLPNLVAQLLGAFVVPSIAAAPGAAAAPEPAPPVGAPEAGRARRPTRPGQIQPVQPEDSAPAAPASERSRRPTRPGQDDSAQPAEPAQPASPDAWKNKWLYLGIDYGADIYRWSYTWSYLTSYYPYYESGEEKWSEALHGLGLSAELSLFRFFSIEWGINFRFGRLFDDGYSDIYPQMPMLAKLGGRFAQIEFTGDVGYTINLGFSFGGTFGVHLGPGILFVRYLGSPANKIAPWGIYPDWVHMTRLGYKFGLINKRR